MNQEKISELEAKVSKAKEAAETAGGTDESLNKVLQEAETELTAAKKAPSQRVERTPAEIAAFNLQKKAEEARQAGIDPAEVLGIKSKQLQVGDELPDDTPLTVGTFRELSKKDARKTAEQMAEAIADPDERERVKGELKFILASGNAEADFRRAQASANAERNAQITAEALRSGKPRRTAAGGSTDIRNGTQFEPTPEEAIMMGPPYRLSEEKIIAARQRAADKATK